VHDVIYQELCHGVIRQDSRKPYQEIIRELAEKGAESVILGCTEPQSVNICFETNDLSPAMCLRMLCGKEVLWPEQPLTY
jgi:aspartate racemase